MGNQHAPSLVQLIYDKAVPAALGCQSVKAAHKRNGVFLLNAGTVNDMYACPEAVKKNVIVGRPFQVAEHQSAGVPVGIFPDRRLVGRTVFHCVCPVFRRKGYALDVPHVRFVHTVQTALQHRALQILHHQALVRVLRAHLHRRIDGTACGKSPVRVQQGHVLNRELHMLQNVVCPAHDLKRIRECTHIIDRLLRIPDGHAHNAAASAQTEQPRQAFLGRRYVRDDHSTVISRIGKIRVNVVAHQRDIVVHRDASRQPVAAFGEVHRTAAQRRYVCNSVPDGLRAVLDSGAVRAEFFVGHHSVRHNHVIEAVIVHDTRADICPDRIGCCTLGYGKHCRLTSANGKHKCRYDK